MNQKIKDHVTKHLLSEGYVVKNEDEIIETIRDSDIIHKEDCGNSRWWKNTWCVVNIDGMLIGFEDAETTGDDSAQDKGWEFDPESIHEVKAETKEVVVTKTFYEIIWASH